jgi:hypothetical protein
VTSCWRAVAPPGQKVLYAEEIDPHSGRHLGHFPQAFSHLALINAVMHLIRDDESRVAAATSSGLDLHAGAATLPPDEAPQPQ